MIEMTIDKYTKFILTIIAVGIIGLNFHLLHGSIVKDAYAGSPPIYKVAICNEFGTKCANIFKDGRKSWLRISQR